MTDCTHYWTVTSECPKCLRVLLDAEREAHAHTTAERDSHRSAVTSPILAMLTAEQRERYGVEPVVPGSHERDPAQLVTRLCDALANVEAERDAAIARAESAEAERDTAVNQAHNVAFALACVALALDEPERPEGIWAPTLLDVHERVRAMRERAESAERERDEARAQVAAMREEAISRQSEEKHVGIVERCGPCGAWWHPGEDEEHANGCAFAPSAGASLAELRALRAVREAARALSAFICECDGTGTCPDCRLRAALDGVPS